MSFVIALAVLLGLALFFFNELRRRPQNEWGRPLLWRKRVRVVLASVPLILACLVFWGFFIEPNRLVVRQQTLSMSNWPRELDGLKVAVLSDIHVNGTWIDDEKLRTIVQRTNELQPDLIVILGDYIAYDGFMSRRVLPNEFGPLLKGFSAPHGVYSVLGNHDWWYDGKEVRAALEQNGLKVLDDEVVQISPRGRSMYLAGFADLWTRSPKPDNTMASVPEGEPVIGITHNGDIFPRVPQRVQLLLAGHTHGGQVRFPLIGSVISSSRLGERYERGHVFENGHHLFVTTGIGTSILAVRFGVPPEIVLLTLQAQ
ncbi:MAG TPA: metallophosphoesterase [Pyrinomonadaceae bacterium]|nr:metallophosphoesterase [Pyrinomonadaceae bacterium]